MKNYNQFLEGIRWYVDGEFLPEEELGDGIGKYDDFITDDRFRQFLIERGAYELYIKNVYEHNPYAFDFANEFNQVDYTAYIDMAFDWDETNESYGYWFSLSRDWKKIYTE